MSNKLKVNTKDESFNEILSNGKKYFVPKFQRDYSWEEQEWQDLWEDIKMLVANQDEYHYMGYLVLQESQDSLQQFKIIDGQQRLATFSLLVLAAIKRLKEMQNEQVRIDSLLNSFIGSKDLVYLRVENKLKLNRNNDYYYRQAVDGQELPRRGVKRTVNLMRKSLDYFYDCFREYSDGARIGALVQQITQRMLFTTIYIGDELNAYKVFETLNARGVKLSSADLVKNYLFSLIDSSNDAPDEVLDELDEKWDKIGEAIGKQKYTHYILTQWDSSHPLTRQTELFKRITLEIKGKEKAISYLDTLVQSSQLYKALWSSEDEFWKDSPKYIDIKRDLYCLSLFSITKPHSLLMAVYTSLREDFPRILHWIKVLSLRYNVICRNHPGEQIRLYSSICVEITKGCRPSDVKEKLMKLYPNDERFKQRFLEKTLPTTQSNKKARYLLARLEEYESKTDDIDETSLTVEHILPLTPNADWCDYFGESWKLGNERLGNMALVKPAENKKLGQNPFAVKKELLAKTAYRINQNISDYSEWNLEAIHSRQDKLAEQAVKLWRID